MGNFGVGDHEVFSPNCALSTLSTGYSAHSSWDSGSAFNSSRTSRQFGIA